MASSIILVRYLLCVFTIFTTHTCCVRSQTSLWLQNSIKEEAAQEALTCLDAVSMHFSHWPLSAYMSRAAMTSTPTSWGENAPENQDGWQGSPSTLMYNLNILPASSHPYMHPTAYNYTLIYVGAVFCPKYILLTIIQKGILSLYLSMPFISRCTFTIFRTLLQWFNTSANNSSTFNGNIQWARRNFLSFLRL